MALTEHKTTLPVYRHASDNPASDCGRACAQMVITSLHLGSQNSPAAVAADPVPVTQQTLRSLETYESANGNKDGPGDWFTFPPELVALLNSNPELQALSWAYWQIVKYSAVSNPGRARANVLKAIAKALAATGMPAILNLKTSDHWVLVTRAWADASFKVDSIQFADPLGWPSNVTGRRHTYRDDCEQSGSDYWMVNTSTDLADMDLKIGSGTPVTFKNKCLAVIYKQPASGQSSPPPPPLPPPPPPQLPALAPPPGASGTQVTVFKSLHTIASRLGLNEVAQLLGAGSQVRVWRVKDADGSDEQYALALVTSHNSRRAVIAVCNPDTFEVGRFRLAAWSAGLNSLTAVPESETLYWSRRVEFAYWQPFFPFRRDPAGQFRRLIDGFELS